MSPAPVVIRPATTADAEAMLAIYAPIVERTAISFETAPPSVEEFAGRVRKILERWACLAAEADGRVLGYAYGSSHRERAAYRWSTETSAYVAESARGQGVGAALYRELMPRLAELGFCNAYAGVALPNPASVALHERAGFRPIGVFPKVGRKFGRWHDVAWYHRTLRDRPLSDEA